MYKDFSTIHLGKSDPGVSDVHVASTAWSRGRKGKKKPEEIGDVGPVDVTPAAKGDLPAVATMTVHGIQIMIETKKGSKRAEEAAPLLAHYGRVSGTIGADRDEIDTFIGDATDSDRIWVINEALPSGEFHQSKLMLAFGRKSDAVAAYESGKSPGRQAAEIIKTSLPELKAWLAAGPEKTTGPFPGGTLAVGWVPKQARAMPEGEAGRKLEPFGADGLAKNPLKVERDALSRIRPDQTPRLFEALTHPDRLEMRKMTLADLTAIQDRVDPQKIEAMIAGERSMDKRPVVVRFAGENRVVDGDHHLAARWLLGKNQAKVRFLDLSPKTEAMKRAPGAEESSWLASLEVKKVDEEKRQIFGWASVVTKGGEPIIDRQGDIIEIGEIENAAYDYVLYSRNQGDMHNKSVVGQLIESCVFSIEKQNALGIEIRDEDGDRIEGWWTGFFIRDEACWQAHKRGERPELSIGGVAIPVEVE